MANVTTCENCGHVRTQAERFEEMGRALWCQPCIRAAVAARAVPAPQAPPCDCEIDHDAELVGEDWHASERIVFCAKHSAVDALIEELDSLSSLADEVQGDPDSGSDARLRKRLERGVVSALAALALVQEKPCATK